MKVSPGNRSISAQLNAALLGLTVCLANSLTNATSLAARPNVVFITVDDMNCDSVGAYGCPLPEITPAIDSLAASGMRFEHAHVTIAICQPTRAVWMTGRYPHRNGALGFDPINADVPTLVRSITRCRILHRNPRQDDACGSDTGGRLERSNKDGTTRLRS